MTKIKDYLADSTVSKTDKLIGTDSADNATRTYTLESLGGFINQLPSAIQSSSENIVSVVSESPKVVVLTYEGDPFTGNAIIVNLHSAVDNDGVIYNIVSTNGNDIIFYPFEGELIDKVATTFVSEKTSILAYGGNWYTI